MKILHISDTHGLHLFLNDLPKADVIVHSGDCSNNINPHLNAIEVEAFMAWFNDLPYKHKIYVPGNHDTSISHGMKYFSAPNVTILINESIEINGIKFYGSPYTPSFGNVNWAYIKDRGKLSIIWELIPEDTKVLITHGPRKGVLDLTHDINSNNVIQVGCKSLGNFVEKYSIPYHLHGHIHQEKGCNNYGMFDNGITKTFNSSCVMFGRSIDDSKIFPGQLFEIA